MGQKERLQKRLMIMNLFEGHQIFICAKDDNHTVFSFPVIEDKAWVKENQIKSVVEIPTMDNRQWYINSSMACQLVSE